MNFCALALSNRHRRMF